VGSQKWTVVTRSNGIQYKIFYTNPDTEFKPSLRPPGGAEGPLVIGTRGGTDICDWLDLLDQMSVNLAKSEMKRLSPLIGR